MSLLSWVVVGGVLVVDCRCCHGLLLAGLVVLVWWRHWWCILKKHTSAHRKTTIPFEILLLSCVGVGGGDGSVNCYRFCCWFCFVFDTVDSTADVMLWLWLVLFLHQRCRLNLPCNRYRHGRGHTQRQVRTRASKIANLKRNRNTRRRVCERTKAGRLSKRQPAGPCSND